MGKMLFALQDVLRHLRYMDNPDFCRWFAKGEPVLLSYADQVAKKMFPAYLFGGAVSLPGVIHEIRLKREIKQREAAEYLGVSRSSYSYYEEGRTPINIKRLRLLSHLFRVPFFSLLYELFMDSFTIYLPGEMAEIRHRTEQLIFATALIMPEKDFRAFMERFYHSLPGSG